jgi:hypothetical protein
MMSLTNGVSLPSFRLFLELEKAGMSRDELGQHLVKNIPVYKDMIAKKAPKAIAAPPAVGDDLAKRRIHALMTSRTKAAALPAAAVPWMHMINKAKVPRTVIPSKKTVMPTHSTPKPKQNFATPGGAPGLSPSSIKSIGTMSPEGKLVKVKLA